MRDQNAKTESSKITSVEWCIEGLPERVDSFNFAEIKEHVEKKLTDKTKFLALDFSKTRFLSLTFIQYLSKVAERLNSVSGQLSIIAIPEKLKRQISIYASVDNLYFVSQKKHLDN